MLEQHIARNKLIAIAIATAMAARCKTLPMPLLRFASAERTVDGLYVPNVRSFKVVSPGVNQSWLWLIRDPKRFCSIQVVFIALDRCINTTRLSSDHGGMQRTVTANRCSCEHANIFRNWHSETLSCISFSSDFKSGWIYFLMNCHRHRHVCRLMKKATYNPDWLGFQAPSDQLVDYRLLTYVRWSKLASLIWISAALKFKLTSKSNRNCHLRIEGPKIRKKLPKNSLSTLASSGIFQQLCPASLLAQISYLE